MPLFTTENQAFSGHITGFWSYLGAMPTTPITKNNALFPGKHGVTA